MAGARRENPLDRDRGRPHRVPRLMLQWGIRLVRNRSDASPSPPSAGRHGGAGRHCGGRGRRDSARRGPAQGGSAEARGSRALSRLVALHGCNGLRNSAGQLGTRYRDWGGRLVAQGFAVIYPDSFGSRGLGSQCAVRERRVRSSRERVADANAARRWLQEQSWVKADRVSLIGWSSAPPHATARRISARRSLSTRAAAGSMTPPGARAFRP